MAGHRIRRSAFTLLQLFVVIGIITLLAAMLIPQIHKARAHGRLVRCVSNLHQIDLAFKNRHEGKLATRLPYAGDWVSVVFDVPGGNRILQCPDGEADNLPSQGGGLEFHAWNGNGSSSPQSSRFNGSADWRKERIDLTPDHYQQIYVYHPGKGGRLVVDFVRISGDMWNATVLEEPTGYRTDCLSFPDGKRYNDISVGFSVRFGTSRSMDYGYNYMASNLKDARNDKVLVMDYRRELIDLDGLPTPVNDDDDISVTLPRQRHLKRINALMSDGSVRTLEQWQVQPQEDIYALHYKRGPNPGATVLASSGGGGSSSGGGGGGNGKGGGKGGGGKNKP